MSLRVCVCVPQVELHGRSFAQTLMLVSSLQRAGLRLFSIEPNHWGCMGSKCVEMSFVSPAHAFRSFVHTHPSCEHADQNGSRSEEQVEVDVEEQAAAEAGGGGQVP